MLSGSGYPTPVRTRTPGTGPHQDHGPRTSRTSTGSRTGPGKPLFVLSGVSPNDQKSIMNSNHL